MTQEEQNKLDAIDNDVTRYFEDIPPEKIIQKLEKDNSRLVKEQILTNAMTSNNYELFEGIKWCLDKLHTFGVKQVPIKEDDSGEGLSWTNFSELADMLATRSLTGHAARDAIALSMKMATKEQWNDWYRRILIKDLRCGVSEKTVNRVATRTKCDEYRVPVFTCQLAHDAAKHEAKVKGKKILQMKLDGIRALCVINWESKSVKLYTRNGRELVNFPHITNALTEQIGNFGRSYILDAEIISGSFQSLMTQVQRKRNVKSEDAVLNVFDIVPLVEFKQGKSTMGQKARCNFLDGFKNVLEETGVCNVVPWELVDLDTDEGQARLAEFNQATIDAGLEGIMIKDPAALYECKRSVAWLKMKPWIQVTLTVIAVERGTGRNSNRMGALKCFGVDDDKTIQVNVGGGYSDKQRDEFWIDRAQVVDQLVEIRADAVTQSKNDDNIWSLRFPRFVCFRGFTPGEKI